MFDLVLVGLFILAVGAFIADYSATYEVHFEWLAWARLFWVFGVLVTIIGLFFWATEVMVTLIVLFVVIPWTLVKVNSAGIQSDTPEGE